MAKARKRTESASVTDQPFDPGQPDHALLPELPDHRDRVAQRAYELYLARGGRDGGDFDDWLAAERELAAGNGNASRGDAGE